ncbi:phosphate transporter, partial [Planoprotostelium fungivorum]
MESTSSSSSFIKNPNFSAPAAEAKRNTSFIMLASVVALLSVGGVFAFLMAFSIGANDFANALGTSVGSGAFTLKQAIILGSLFEFAGSVIMGQYVTSTIKTGLVNPESFKEEEVLFVLGMFCALISAVLWILLATYYKLPVSSTHSVVGGVLAFGLVQKGLNGPNWKALSRIVLSWFTSPLLGCSIAFALYYTVSRCVYVWKFPLSWDWKRAPHTFANRAKKLLPFFAAFTAFILVIFIVDAEASRFHPLPFWAELLIGLATAAVI